MSAERGDERRPKATYRRFLYLDAEDIVNSLSSVQGGLVEKATERVLETSGGNVGASFERGGLRLELGSKKGKDVERQMELRQTVHFAVSALLDELDDAKQIARPRALDFNLIEENRLVEFHADLYLCRSKETATDAEAGDTNPSLWKQLFGQPKDESHELRKEGIGADAIAVADTTEAGWQPLILRLKAEYLRVPPSDFCRRGTVVGQVEGRPLANEVVRLVTDKHGSRASILKRTDDVPEIRFAGTGGGLPAGAADGGANEAAQTISIREFDRWLPTDSVNVATQIKTVLVRPLCIYK